MYLRTLSRKVLLIAAAMILTLPLSLEAGKAVPVTVTAANPSQAIQGAELDVIVSGTGFGVGSTVSYLVTGTTDASQVVVTSVTYLQATGQLKTHIKVSGGAVVTDYDIQVTTSSGRKGKGTTLFKVNPDPSLILPVSLGVPTGCDSSEAFRLNDGVYLAGLSVAGNSYGCITGKDHNYRWQDGSWQDLGTLGSTTAGSTKGVSNDGKVVGWVKSSTGISTAFVASGGMMSPLSVLAGMVHSRAWGISQDGTHIVGESSIAGENDAVRWSKDAGGTWNVEVIGDRPAVFREALASSDDGSVLVGMGYKDGNSAVWEGWVWVEGGSPAWVSLGADTYAFDIDPAATMIVGFRYERNCGTPCEYAVPVYWTFNGAGWEIHDLTALGVGLENEAWARGVGMVNNVGLVIVGNARKDGSTGQAVAWLPQSGGSYGSPIRLAAIDKDPSLGGMASDVNANGVVAGFSYVRQVSGQGKARASLWMLPGTP